MSGNRQPLPTGPYSLGFYQAVARDVPDGRGAAPTRAQPARPLINPHVPADREANLDPNRPLAAGETGAQAQPSSGKKRRKPRALGQRLFSTLTLRILAVNLLALIFLVAGVLFLGQYRNQLVERELATLSVEARVFAAMVSEGAVIDPTQVERDLALSPQLGRQMVRRLTETTQVRSRLFNADGQLLADSHLLRSGLGLVEIEELPPLTNAEPEPLSQVSQVFDTFMGAVLPSLYGAQNFQPYTTANQGLALVGPARQNVTRALLGTVNANAWGERDEGMIFTAAAPVQQFKKVLGAVLLIRDGSVVDQAMTEVRRSILYMSMIALAVTVLLSFYLAGTIERPLKRLARAAERVRNSPGRTAHIPDFTARNDEIGDLSQALRDMTESLWQRLDSIEAFAADVAHEIKNPLTSLRSAVETASRLSDPEQQRKLMGIIQDDVRRLDRLISDISDASRLDAELSRADAEMVDVRTMLGMLTDIHQHTVQVDKPDAPRMELGITGRGKLQVLAIEGRLVQVLQNLIGNAISFSPPGGTLWLKAQRQGQRVLISVEDEGPGIPEGKLEAIFDRFYSERPRDEKFGTHSGLGLSISKQIIEAINGRIYAENRYQHNRVIGARFVIDLPISSAGSTRRVAVPDALPSRGLDAAVSARASRVRESSF
ncbi:MAG: stimulus-sensing domain-containing protein [Pseudomonadota bacterium]